MTPLERMNARTIRRDQLASALRPALLIAAIAAAVFTAHLITKGAQIAAHNEVAYRGCVERGC